MQAEVNTNSLSSGDQSDAGSQVALRNRMSTYSTSSLCSDVSDSPRATGRRGSFAYNKRKSTAMTVSTTASSGSGGKRPGPVRRVLDFINDTNAHFFEK